MGTFNFDFKCNVCRIGRKNRFMAFANKFDRYIENKIETFICCNQCSEMYKYEEIYSDLKYYSFCKQKKQLHCLLLYFDDEYKKLKNMKEKKKFFTNLLTFSNFYINKSLIKKFMNDESNIQKVEIFKRSIICNYNTKEYFYYMYGEFFSDTTSFRNSYQVNNLNLFKIMLQSYIIYLIRFSKTYFNKYGICDYIINGIFD